MGNAQADAEAFRNGYRDRGPDPGLNRMRWRRRGNMCGEERAVFIICCSVPAIILIIMALCSFTTVHTLELALSRDTISQTVSSKTLTPGLHFFGSPFFEIIRYPNTMQVMQFSTHMSPHDELHTRTSDGLQVTLEVTYQYQFIPAEVRDLYMDYGNNGYQVVYFDVASHLITEEATTHTAYEFFNSKEAIAHKMQSKLDNYFKAHLHATVISLQILSYVLPESFNLAITDTVTQRQNITNAEKYVQQMQVQLDTDIIVAEKMANATMYVAHKDAEQIMLGYDAKAVVATQNGEAEALSYSVAKNRLKLSNSDILDYIWWDLVENSAESSLLVGVNIEPTSFVESVPDDGNR